jgi:hypothetical protein
VADSRGDERVSGVDHEHSDDGQRGSGSGGGSAGPNLGLTGLGVFFLIFKSQFSGSVVIYANRHYKYLFLLFKLYRFLKPTL